MYLRWVLLGHKGTHLQVNNYRVIALENLDFRKNCGYSKTYISAPEVTRTTFLTSYERYKTYLHHTERSKLHTVVTWEIHGQIWTFFVFAKNLFCLYFRFENIGSKKDSHLDVLWGFLPQIYNVWQVGSGWPEVQGQLSRCHMKDQTEIYIISKHDCASTVAIWTINNWTWSGSSLYRNIS